MQPVAEPGPTGWPRIPFGASRDTPAGIGQGSGRDGTGRDSHLQCPSCRPANAPCVKDPVSAIPTTPPSLGTVLPAPAAAKARPVLPVLPAIPPAPPPRRAPPSHHRPYTYTGTCATYPYPHVQRSEIMGTPPDAIVPSGMEFEIVHWSGAGGDRPRVAVLRDVPLPSSAAAAAAIAARVAGAADPAGQLGPALAWVSKQLSAATGNCPSMATSSLLATFAFGTRARMSVGRTPQEVPILFWGATVADSASGAGRILPG